MTHFTQQKVFKFFNNKIWELVIEKKNKKNIYIQWQLQLLRVAIIACTLKSMHSISSFMNAKIVCSTDLGKDSQVLSSITDDICTPNQTI